MDLPIEALAANWAPLPRPMITHLLSTLQFPDSEELTWEVNVHRANVFDRFHPAVSSAGEQENYIKIDWALQQISAVLKKDFARSTLFNWHQRGFIEYGRRGYLLPEDVARILLYFSLFHESQISIPERDILPSTLRERNSWCWSQRSPLDPATPFMLPRPNEPYPDTSLDKHLFWTPWPGTIWNQRGRWIQVGGLGAITCGFMLFHTEGLDYNFFQRFLALWSPSTYSDIPYFRDISPYGNRLQRYELPATYMRIVLWNLAVSRLTGPTFSD